MNSLKVQLLQKLPWCNCWHQFILYFSSFEWDINKKILKTVSAYLKLRGSNKASELSISLLVEVQSGLFSCSPLQKAFGTSQDHISCSLGTVQCKKRKIKMLTEKDLNWLVEKDYLYSRRLLWLFTADLVDIEIPTCLELL